MLWTKWRCNEMQKVWYNSVLILLEVGCCSNFKVNISAYKYHKSLILFIYYLYYLSYTYIIFWYVVICYVDVAWYCTVSHYIRKSTFSRTTESSTKGSTFRRLNRLLLIFNAFHNNNRYTFIINLSNALNW